MRCSRSSPAGPGTWQDAEAIAQTMSAIHHVGGLELPHTVIAEDCITVLRHHGNHPWMSDLRDEIMAGVDRLKAVIEQVRSIEVAEVV